MPYLDCVQYNNNKADRTTLFGVKRQWRPAAQSARPRNAISCTLYNPPAASMLLLKYIKSFSDEFI